MKRVFFGAAIAAAILSSSVVAASAADSYVIGGEPVLFVTESGAARWDGAYAGVTLGGVVDGTVQDINNAKAAARETDGIFGGVHAGYNWQLDNGVVLGVEGDVVLGGAEANWVDGQFYGSDTINGSGSLRARAGYNVNDTVLPYVTGGVVVAHTTNELGCTAGNPFSSCKTAFNETSDQFVLGYTVGAGLELAVDDNVSVRSEYRYTKFQDSEVTLAGVGRNFANENHAVTVGLSYKF